MELQSAPINTDTDGAKESVCIKRVEFKENVRHPHQSLFQIHFFFLICHCTFYLELGLEGEHQYLNASLALQLCTTWLNRSLEKGKTIEGLIFFYFFRVASFFNIMLINNNIIGQGWVEYCDLSVASRSIFCQSWREAARHWQIMIFCNYWVQLFYHVIT